MIWGYLIHLSYNMWHDWDGADPDRPWLNAQPYLRCDDSLWRDVTLDLAAAGANMLVIDLGDAVQYESRPEIAVGGAWSVDKLKRELARLRKMGIEPIPKLNFSGTHDIWLGQYSRCVSTPVYYSVCRDLIAEVIDIFEQPRFFHLGMDEECYQHQRLQEYVVIRQFDLWWRDLLFYVGEVEKGGTRPWIWSDYVWDHPDEFYARMPKSVLQSNWYYGQEFDAQALQDKKHLRAYLELDEHGFDQIPTGSNWANPINFEQTPRFCREHIAPERLNGFLQSVWQPTLTEYRSRHTEAIEQIRRARAEWESRASDRP